MHEGTPQQPNGGETPTEVAFRGKKVINVVDEGRSEKEKQIRQRIADKIGALVALSNKTERRVSLDLGHSPSYINSIISGRTIPSLTELFEICDYFHIAPSEFFSAIENENQVPSRTAREMATKIETLSEEDQGLVSALIERLSSSEAE